MSAATAINKFDVWAKIESLWRNFGQKTKLWLSDFGSFRRMVCYGSCIGGITR